MSIAKQVLNVKIRRLGIEDINKVVDLYNSLSTESIYYRFRGFFKDFEGYLKSIFSKPYNIVYGAFLGDELVGIFEAVYISDGCYELAIVVRDEYQNKGIGTRLVAYAFDDLKEKGVKTMIAYTTPDNYRILAISRKFNGDIRCTFGECIVTFNLTTMDTKCFLTSPS